MRYFSTMLNTNVTCLLYYMQWFVRIRSKSGRGWTLFHRSITALYLLLGTVLFSLETNGLLPWPLQSTAKTAVLLPLGLCRCPAITLSLCCAAICLSEPPPQLLDAMLLPCLWKEDPWEPVRGQLNDAFLTVGNINFESQSVLNGWQTFNTVSEKRCSFNFVTIQ